MSDASNSPESPAVPGSSTPTASPPAPRRNLFIGVGAAIVVVLLLWSWLGRSGKGGAELSINLVTSDRDDLACASERTFGHYRCEFKAPGVPWPDPPAPADRLAPYYTVDQQLYVIPALFEQPVLAARYKEEQPKNLPRDQRPRFAARCQLKVIDRLRDFQTRWVKTGDWGHQDDAPVAIPSDCQIP